jgi:hypothetical protein
MLLRQFRRPRRLLRLPFIERRRSVGSDDTTAGRAGMRLHRRLRVLLRRRRLPSRWAEQRLLQRFVLRASHGERDRCMAGHDRASNGCLRGACQRRHLHLLSFDTALLCECLGRRDRAVADDHELSRLIVSIQLRLERRLPLLRKSRGGRFLLRADRCSQSASPPAPKSAALPKVRVPHSRVGKRRRRQCDGRRHHRGGPDVWQGHRRCSRLQLRFTGVDERRLQDDGGELEYGIQL